MRGRLLGLLLACIPLCVPAAELAGTPEKEAITLIDMR